MAEKIIKLQFQTFRPKRAVHYRTTASNFIRQRANGFLLDNMYTLRFTLIDNFCKLKENKGRKEEKREDG